MCTIQLVLPPLPPVQPDLLSSSVHNTGASITNFIQRTYGAVDPKYAEACANCDKIREELRNGGYSADRPSSFAEYVLYLSILTVDIDLGPRGANVGFTWGKTTLKEYHFDVVCLGYNIVVRMLRDAAGLADLPNLGGIFSVGRAIIEKILSLYSDTFAPVLTHKMIENVRDILIAYNSYVVVRNAVEKSAKGKLVAEIAHTTAFLMKEIDEKHHAYFLDVAAMMLMCESLYEDGAYGLGIAYGNSVMEMVDANTAKNSKDKKKVPLAAEVNALVSAFKPSLAEKKSQNVSIYSQSIPTEIPEIDMKSPLINMQGKYEWELDMDVEPFSNPVVGCIQREAQTTMDAVETQVTGMLEAIDAVIPRYPGAALTEVMGLLITLDREKTGCLGLLAAVQQAIIAKSDQVSRRMPRVGELIGQMKGQVLQAQSGDATLAAKRQQFESSKAKIDSELGSLNGHRSCLAETNVAVRGIGTAALDSIADNDVAAMAGHLNRMREMFGQYNQTITQCSLDANQAITSVIPSLEEISGLIHVLTASVNAGMTFYTGLSKQLHTIKGHIDGL